MIEIKNVSKTYITKGNVSTRALSNVSLTLEEKGLVYILGKSGSGKSTLLNVISGLDKFDKGDILIYGNSIKEFKEKEYDFYRNTFVGFVFQEFNLIQNLSVYENVELAMSLQNQKEPSLIYETLEKVGLTDQAKQKGYQLSGGQVQRTAIARCIIKNPKVLFADEPTGSLDRSTSDEIIQIFKELSKTILVVIVSHNRDDASKYADRIIEVEDGRIIKDLVTSSLVNTVDNSNVAQIIGEKVVVLEKGNVLENDDLAKINTLLLQERRDYYISIENDVNKVKAYYPYLREAISSDNASNLKNIEENEVTPTTRFSQYQSKPEEFQEIHLIKSHLPFLKGLKLGASYLRVKVFRLVVTLILAISSVTLYGIGDNFSNYDIYYAIAKSTKNAQIKYSEVVSDSLFYPHNIQTIEKVVKKTADKNYSIPLTVYDSLYAQTQLFNGTFSGFVETDNPEQFGYPFLIKSDDYDSTPNDEGIVISSLAAYYINSKSGHFPRLELLIDTPLFIYDHPFKIIGILDVDFEQVINSYSYNYGNFDELNNQVYSRLFVKKGFREVIDQFPQSELYCTLTDLNEYFSRVKTIKGFNQTLYTVTDNSDEKGIYVDGNTYAALKGAKKVTLDVSASFKDHLVYKTFIIKGFLHTASSSTIYFDDELYSSTIQDILQPSSLIFYFGKDSTYQVSNFYRKIYSQGLQIRGEVVSVYYYTGIGFTYLGKMFQAFAIIVFLLVIILLYSFMLFSIKEHTKQIGILRAIGASKKDVMSIFLLEAAVIALITIVSAIITFGLACSWINTISNQGLANMVNVKIIFATFNISTISKMFGVTLVVVAISLIFPLLRVMKLQPVEAIREKTGN
jgi:ABC-type lipoprotein export system ATPase subunit